MRNYRSAALLSGLCVSLKTNVVIRIVLTGKAHPSPSFQYSLDKLVVVTLILYPESVRARLLLSKA
jgi:hypothetical protein